MNDLNQMIANCKQNAELKAGLYIVATPIGNIHDITIRALSILANVDIIFCEDTRVSGKLLAHYGLNKKTFCYNDYSDEKDRENIINLILAGNKIALISDAGTPLISDPGYKLIRELINKKIYVTSSPGPTALITALTLSSMATDQFYFLGFLPNKENARQKALTSLKTIATTLIFYETALRLTACLSDIKLILGDKPACIARELTKSHEESVTGTVSEIIKYYETHTLKGECVIILDNREAKKFSEDEIDELIAKYSKELSAKDTAQIIADITGVSKKIIYQKIIGR